MKVIVIIGPQAAGKMTVGQELAELTGYKLFHNHLPIELVNPFFGYGDPIGRKLVNRIRTLFFDAFAESDHAGLILTFVWQFDEEDDRKYMAEVARLFESKGAEILWVELEAPLDVRLERKPVREPPEAQTIKARLGVFRASFGREPCEPSNEFD